YLKLQSHATLNHVDGRHRLASRSLTTWIMSWTVKLILAKSPALKMVRSSGLSARGKAVIVNEMAHDFLPEAPENQQGCLKMDRISKLPTGIIETILCLMPIQDAARTSVLSREWRYHWTKIPKLAFIERTFQVSNNQADLSVLEQTFSSSIRKTMYKRRKLLYAIYQVLLIHQGPIHEFTLRMDVDDFYVEINHIILHLVNRNTVKILQLDLAGHYALPLSFCSLHQLTNLSVRNCSFDRLLSFSGFCCLTTLCLQHASINVKTLMCLLSSCPLLKRLTLEYDSDILSDDEDFTIVDTIVDLFKCLPVIEYLYVPCYIVGHVVPERLPKELPTTLIHLKFLDIHRALVGHKHDLPFLALLIRSSPNLEKLKLDMYDDRDNFEDNEFSSTTPKDYFDFTLEHLNELELLYFCETDDELDFVKLILAKSPVLKKVRILPCFDKEAESELKEFIPKVLLSSPCASPSVKIIVGQQGCFKMDIISKLPPGIIETILCLLPIQDSARTSILSREWRYHWTKIPKLAFIERTFQVSNNQADLSVLEETFSSDKRERMYKRRKLFCAIYQVLLIHQGPIHEFTLRMEYYISDPCVEINHIMLHLSNRNTVKILQLDLGGRYVLPLSFCSLHQLTNLSLGSCSFDRLLSFSGFGCLTTLCLEQTSINVKTLMCLLSSCPLLKRLTLDYDTDILSDDEDFTIVDLFKCLPVIEYLYIPCYIVGHVVPERLPKELPTTLIHLKFLDIHRALVDHKHDLPFLALLIRSSPNLEKLKLYDYNGEIISDDKAFTIRFAPERLPKELPTTLIHLKCLDIHPVCVSHKHELPFLALLIRSSPNLEKLKLYMYDEYNLEVYEFSSSTPEDYFDFTLEHLNELELLNFSETDDELDFVKLILDKSPVLKNVRIFPYPHSDEEDESKLKEFIPKVLLRSPCASPSSN
ncbi:hypothetical protein M8C21_008719, partial [Ambrosia artemisiifolia]